MKKACSKLANLSVKSGKFNANPDQAFLLGLRLVAESN